jgi:urease accessory protein UreH
MLNQAAAWHSGERWKFREFASETQLRIDGQLAYLDRFRLRPDGSERSPCVMGGGAYLGTGLCVAELARTFAAELHEAMPQAGIDSPAADLAVARVVSATGPEFHRWRDIFSHRSSLSCRRVYSCKPRIARASEGVAGRLP